MIDSRRGTARKYHESRIGRKLRALRAASSDQERPRDPYRVVRPLAAGSASADGPLPLTSAEYDKSGPWNHRAPRGDAHGDETQIAAGVHPSGGRHHRAGRQHAADRRRARARAVQRGRAGAGRGRGGRVRERQDPDRADRRRRPGHGRHPRRAQHARRRNRRRRRHLRRPPDARQGTLGSRRSSPRATIARCWRGPTSTR